MNARAQELLREVLKLSVEDRADLATELIASLDEADDNAEAVEAAWADEIETRANRVLSRESDGENWAEVRDRIERGLRAE